MNIIGRAIICTIFLFTCFSSAHAVSTFGAFALGNDLEPVHASLQDGGEGSSFASVNFTTFDVEAGFDPLSTYLPILKARSTGVDATFDDDRTNTSAEAYQVFTSSMTQTITIDIRLDSVVTNAADGTSGVLSNIYVIGGPEFGIQRGSCSPGQGTIPSLSSSFSLVYLCGNRIAQSSRGLNFSNLFNGGSSPVLTDFLVFDVAAGESFGIYADLSAGSFKGTADAFNTLTMGFEDDEFIDVVNVPMPPAVVPLPAGVWLFITGMLGIFGLRRKLKK
jgi:hypothetical protein